MEARCESAEILAAASGDILDRGRRGGGDLEYRLGRLGGHEFAVCMNLLKQHPGRTWSCMTRTAQDTRWRQCHCMLPEADLRVKVKKSDRVAD